MWSLFCLYKFLISPSFGALVRQCFVITSFSRGIFTLVLQVRLMVVAEDSS